MQYGDGVREDENSFSSDITCYLNCKAKFNTQKSGCLNHGYVKANQFYSQPFKYCIPLGIQQKQDLTQCKTLCKQNCNLNEFKMFTKIIPKPLKYINSSLINLFPDEKPYLAYIYTPKMDTHQLVYELGGIISLWFGLSAYSIILTTINILRKNITTISIY